MKEEEKAVALELHESAVPTQRERKREFTFRLLHPGRLASSRNVFVAISQPALKSSPDSK